MPYLQIFITANRSVIPHSPHIETLHSFSFKSEAETRTALEELREHFPLKQSEGRIYRMSSYSILFEQPEHMALTLEQALWLEQHGYDSLCCVNFYKDQSDGCRTCGAPFDDAPPGYMCEDRYISNPYQITNVPVPYSDEEIRYLESIPYQNRLSTRQTVLTLADVIERANDRSAVEELLATDQFSSRVANFIATGQCNTCQQPLAQCTCPPPQTRRTGPMIRLTHQEYARLQAITDRYGLRLERLMRPYDIPEIRMATMSRNATIGQAPECDFTFWLPFFAQPHYSTGKHLNPDLHPAILAVDLPRGAHPGLSIQEYHLTVQATSLAQTLPLLTDHAIDMLLGLPTKTAEQSHLAWCKEQLQQISPVTYQAAEPCTEREITELEQEIDASLPEAYKEFLAWMGHGAGSFMRYLDCFYPLLANHQQAARALLEQDASPATLPDDAVVFHMISDRFAFFRTSEGADPPIYAHKRDWRVTPFKFAFYRFSDFQAVQLAIYARYHAGNSILTRAQNEDEEQQKLSAIMQARVQAIIKRVSFYDK